MLGAVVNNIAPWPYLHEMYTSIIISCSNAKKYYICPGASGIPELFSIIKSTNYCVSAEYEAFPLFLRKITIPFPWFTEYLQELIPPLKKPLSLEVVIIIKKLIKLLI